MVTEFTGYKTEDGRTFTTRWVAELYEARQAVVDLVEGSSMEHLPTYMGYHYDVFKTYIDAIGACTKKEFDEVEHVMGLKP